MLAFRRLYCILGFCCRGNDLPRAYQCEKFFPQKIPLRLTFDKSVDIDIYILSQGVWMQQLRED